MLQDLFYGIATLILTSTYSGHYIIFFHERKPFNLKNRLIVFRDYNNKKLVAKRSCFIQYTTISVLTTLLEWLIDWKK